MRTKRSTNEVIGPPNDFSNDDQEYLKGKIRQYLQVDDLQELVLIPRDIDQNGDETSLERTNSNNFVVKFSTLYEFKRILGVGGFGVVCQVKCKETMRELAVKITQWNSKSAIALSHESKMLSQQLNHPNIIKVYPQEERFSNYCIMEMELGLESLEHL